MSSEQLKSVAHAPRVWRALALGFSATALTLALCAKPPHAPSERSGASPDAAEPLSAVTIGLPPSTRVNSRPTNNDAQALEALIAIARGRDPKRASAAMESIARIGGDRARLFLAQRFEAATDAELPPLASALATLGDPSARQLLMSATRSTRPATRSAAFDTLALLDTPDVREFMLRALAGREPTAAAGYFLNCREPRALPALERMVKSSDPAQRRTAIDALFAQGASAEAVIVRLLREDSELYDALLQGRPSTSFGRQTLRHASIERVRAGALTSDSAFAFLQQDLSSEAREALVYAARDSATSESALNALSARGDSASLRALDALANDADEGLAQRAACALLSQPDSRSRPFLLRSNRANLKSEAEAALAHINSPGARPI